MNRSRYCTDIIVRVVQIEGMIGGAMVLLPAKPFTWCR